MARVSKSFPYSGKMPHREHRSKKGRGRFSQKYRVRELARKQLLEKLKIKDFENDLWAEK
ncbi:MAG TPA: hypothetical protein VMV95_01955 [Bacillota bacterium]|nr:hypothetical protein [Bacillota bacterium]